MVPDLLNDEEDYIPSLQEPAFVNEGSQETEGFQEGFEEGSLGRREADLQPEEDNIPIVDATHEDLQGLMPTEPLTENVELFAEEHHEGSSQPIE
jgi:hypothetical protein